MSEEVDQFLAAYDEHRVLDQTDYYAQTSAEYERTAGRIGVINGTLLVLAAICGAAGVVWSDQSVWLGLTAAGLSAAAAATTSWADVIGFSANAELYRAAETSLVHLRPTRPAGRAATDDGVERYVHEVEDVLTSEVHMWGETWAKEAAEIEGDDHGAEDTSD